MYAGIDGGKYSLILENVICLLKLLHSGKYLLVVVCARELTLLSFNKIIVRQIIVGC